MLKAADILERDAERNAEIMRTEMGADVGTSLYFVGPLSVRMLRDVAGRITGVCGRVPVVEDVGKRFVLFALFPSWGGSDADFVVVNH